MHSYGYYNDPPVLIDDGSLTYGDYLERCNAPNEPLMHRCGICGKACDSADELVEHHTAYKEQPYEYHAPTGKAGSFSYNIDMLGYRVTPRGCRY